MKRKSIVLFLVLTLLSPLLLSTNILAAESDVIEESLTKDLIVEILDDGRVAPIKDTIQLSEDNLDLILERIGYPADSIENWDIARKRELASYGGEVIKGYISDSKHEYVSSDGNTYTVTADNKNEIREIQIEDLKKAGVSNEQIENYNLIEEEAFDTISTLGGSYTYPGSGTFQDGQWSGTISIAKVGETSTQYEYVVSLDYYWNQQPLVYYGDNAGIAWDGVGNARYSSLSTQHAVYYGSAWTVFPNSVTQLNNYGTSVEMDHNASFCGKQMGYIQEVITVSKSMAGQEKGLSAAYSHPWSANDWSISVSAGGLSFSGSTSILNGDKWLWGYNFTVQ